MLMNFDPNVDEPTGGHWSTEVAFLLPIQPTWVQTQQKGIFQGRMCYGYKSNLQRLIEGIEVQFQLEAVQLKVSYCSPTEGKLSQRFKIT